MNPYRFILSLGLWALLCSAATVTSAAEDHGRGYGLSLAAGEGALNQRHDSWRLAAQRHWQARWWENNYWHFTGYWDLGLSLWDASQLRRVATDSGAARIYALGLSPVLRWQFEPLGATHIAPFMELAVGFSVLSDRALRSGKIHSRPLGSYWQFEDRGVIGVRFGARGRFELAYLRMHHSNLNLASDNHGVDSHLLMLGYRL